MTAVRTAAAGAALAAALAAAGCSAGGGNAPSPGASRTPTASASQAASRAALPPDCDQALSVLPGKAPATQKQAADDVAQLGGHGDENTTDSLAASVAADSNDIGFDLALGNSVAADVAKWDQDAKALRNYCS